MKKITTLMIVASMALTGAVMAQESTPEASQPATKKQAPPEKKPRAEKPTTTKAPKTDASAVKESTATESPAPTAPTTKTDRKSNRKNPSAVAPNANAEKSPAASATPDATKNQSRKNNKNSKAPASSASASPSASTAKTTATPAAKASASTAPVASTTPAAAASTTPAAAASTTPVTGATINPVTTPGASAAPSASQNASTNVAAAKKLDTQKVEQIKQQHTSFRAQARPDRVPAVTFSANFRLPGSEHWQGPQYEVYRSYHPERHDRGWYTSRHPRVELIAGGYYYFDNGYWYPAWGYDSAHEYYAYDAPIYVGKRAEPPDRVIADVQAALQDMGYYKGEVDGLIGPLTRDALTKYQTDNGMTVTAVIDEPTLDSLNMG